MKKYYQDQTEKALENFPFSLPRVHLELIYTIVEVKKAVVIANYLAGDLDIERKQAIINACDEILSNPAGVPPQACKGGGESKVLCLIE